MIKKNDLNIKTGFYNNLRLKRTSSFGKKIECDENYAKNINIKKELNCNYSQKKGSVKSDGVLWGRQK